MPRQYVEAEGFSWNRGILRENRFQQLVLHKARLDSDNAYNFYLEDLRPFEGDSDSLAQPRESGDGCQVWVLSDEIVPELFHRSKGVAATAGFDPLSTLPADWKERVKGHLYPTGRSFRQQANTPPTEVLPFLEKAAAANDDFALYSLGVLYEQGQGVVPDYTQARYWYERAAAARNADAMYDLGMLYYYGKGVTQDYGRVREWSQKAAEAGSKSAMFRLGELFQYGRGVAQDYGQAREWYQKAAEAGDAQAKEALSRLPPGRNTFARSRLAVGHPQIW